jgi:hypothetical protein
MNFSLDFRARPKICAMEIKFSGDIWYWRGPAPFHFVSIPEVKGKEIKAISQRVTYGWGVIPVIATIGKTEWTTSLFPKDGTYALPIKKAVRSSEKLEVGDLVKVLIEVIE